MRLTVLGSSGTFSSSSSAGSGFLVEHDGTEIVLDLGPGVCAQLQRYTDPVGLAAATLSHSHPDHCSDIFDLYHLFRFGDRPRRKFPVFLPEGLTERILAFLGGEEGQLDPGIRETLALIETKGGDSHEIGPFSLLFGDMEHGVPAIGVDVKSPGGRLTFSGDTGPGGELRTLGAGTDLLIAEATYVGHIKPWPQHLTATEAGGLAAECGAGRLLLTHLRPELDPVVVRNEAAAVFPGPVDVAVPGLVVELG